ncbi:MAG: carbohydrate ABC transporter permease [Lachnospiraceae bacterium]|jgi:ABC-type glycerol-3-phosphate transport system permease component|nr:carbohydrate ABC transporter permease [Lachnospiraceae bacterium]
MKSSARKSSRSFMGNLLMGIVLFILGFLFFFPVIYMFNQALKPLNEMYMFPPKLFVRNPTLNNFRDLASVLNNTLIPFSRYLFNSLFVVGIGSVGHILIASMCAYPLAKYTFPGSKFISKMIVYSLMFNATVTMVPNFITISKLHLIDSYWAIIFPQFASTLGLYLMINFMEQIPDSLIEAAKIDGASQFQVHMKIMLPLVKPAAVTAFILVFQALWTNTGDKYIYTEKLKSVAYALSQLASGTTVGIARAGVLAAATVVVFIIPVSVFLMMQTNVISTMATSGMKE